MTVASPHPPLRLAVIGLGTVGSHVLSLLETQRELWPARTGRNLEIVAVSARDLTKDRGISLASYRKEPDPLACATAADIDVVVELIGGAEGTARQLVETALLHGKHVVTANKALIATHGAALAAVAARKACALHFEAAVAGGIPVLKCLREGLAANQISRVMGILNGTCNYILTHMWEDKRSFEDVLAEAQALGYAEADPSFDVDGVDAAHKLAILSALAFGTAPNLAALEIEGIRAITLRDMYFADELGYRIRLLGVAEPRTQRVYPTLVSKDSSLASVRGVFNAVQIEADAAGVIFMQGRGAGGAPTASAVMADILDIARGHIFAPPFGVRTLAAASSSAPIAATDSCEYYIRLGVADQPGVLADITAAFRDAGISLKSFIQHQQQGTGPVYIAGTTHAASTEEMHRALAQIDSQPSVIASPFSMRITT